MLNLDKNIKIIVMVMLLYTQLYPMNDIMLAKDDTSNILPSVFQNETLIPIKTMNEIIKDTMKVALIAKPETQVESYGDDSSYNDILATCGPIVNVKKPQNFFKTTINVMFDLFAVPRKVFCPCDKTLYKDVSKSCICNGECTCDGHLRSHIHTHNYYIRKKVSPKELEDSEKTMDPEMLDYYKHMKACPRRGGAPNSLMDYILNCILNREEPKIIRWNKYMNKILSSPYVPQNIFIDGQGLLYGNMHKFKKLDVGFDPHTDPLRYKLEDSLPKTEVVFSINHNITNSMFCDIEATSCIPCYSKTGFINLSKLKLSFNVPDILNISDKWNPISSVVVGFMKLKHMHPLLLQHFHPMISTTPEEESLDPIWFCVGGLSTHKYNYDHNKYIPVTATGNFWMYLKKSLPIELSYPCIYIGTDIVIYCNDMLSINYVVALESLLYPPARLNTPSMWYNYLKWGAVGISATLDFDSHSKQVEIGGLCYRDGHLINVTSVFSPDVTSPYFDKNNKRPIWRPTSTITGWLFAGYIKASIRMESGVCSFSWEVRSRIIPEACKRVDTHQPKAVATEQYSDLIAIVQNIYLCWDMTHCGGGILKCGVYNTPLALHIYSENIYTPADIPERSRYSFPGNITGFYVAYQHSF